MTVTTQPAELDQPVKLDFKEEEGSQEKYVYDVVMHCNGCKGAIEKALTKLGVEFSIDMEKQEVIVTPGTKTEEEVYDAIAKTRKKVTRREKPTEEVVDACA